MLPKASQHWKMKDSKCTSKEGGCFLFDKLNLSVHPTNINDEEET